MATFEYQLPRPTNSRGPISQADFRLGSFASHLSCPRMSASRATSDIATSVDGCMPPVIQGSKREPRTMRYELDDYEWGVTQPSLCLFAPG